MFKKDTLIVLGAGSGRDLKFPLGKVLKTEIAKKFRSKFDDFNRLVESHGNTKFLLSILNDEKVAKNESEIREAWEIIQSGLGLASSIDHFLEMRKEKEAVAICAKAAIADIILSYEFKCKANFEDRNPHKEFHPNFDETWFQQFAQICFEGVGVSDLSEALSRVGVISFNYDRCMEQFIRVALQALYSLPPNEAAIAASNMKFLYPYGSLGPLKDPGQVNRIGFGEYHPTAFRQIWNNIKTFTEQTDEGEISSIKQQVAQARTLVFLGFGFHDQNIKLLQPTDNSIKKTIIGTAVNVANAARDVLTKEISNNFGMVLVPGSQPTTNAANVELKDFCCKKLLDEYRHLLIDKS